MRLEFVYLIALTIAAISATPYHKSQCQDGYTTESSRICFKAYESPMNRTDAAARCMNDGGYLASIQSEHDDYYISNTLMRNPSSHWIGITCSDFKNRICRNDDGTSLGPYTNFVQYDPVEKYSCVTKSVNDPWGLDLSCSLELPFICETTIMNGISMSVFKSSPRQAREDW